MIDQVAELNRILIAIESLSKDFGVRLRIGTVIAYCKALVIEGRMPEHELTIEFAQKLGLLVHRSGHLSLSAEGEAFLSLNESRLYDLTETQKKVLVRSHYLGGEFRRSCKRLFAAFALSQAKETYRWSAVDSRPLEAEPWLIEHLCQLGTLNREDGALEVTSEYTPA